MGNSEAELQRLRAEIKRLQSALTAERRETERWSSEAMTAWARLDALKESSPLVAQPDENKQAAELMAAVIRAEWQQGNPDTRQLWRSVKDFTLARNYTDRTVRRALHDLPASERPKRGRPVKTTTGTKKRPRAPAAHKPTGLPKE